MPKATHLECSLCGAKYDALAVANLCTCGGPLLVRYDLAVIRHRWPRREVAGGPANMWRYAPVLPPAEANVVTLGEGWTPLVRTKRLGARIGAEQLWVKDEGLIPPARSSGAGRGGGARPPAGSSSGQRPRAQSHGFVQGARAGVRGLHVRGARHPENGDSVGRQ